jgi:hypothetical protein
MAGQKYNAFRYRYPGGLTNKLGNAFSYNACSDRYTFVAAYLFLVVTIAAMHACCCYSFTTFHKQASTFGLPIEARTDWGGGYLSTRTLRVKGVRWFRISGVPIKGERSANGDYPSIAVSQFMSNVYTRQTSHEHLCFRRAQYLVSTR